VAVDTQYQPHAAGVQEGHRPQVQDDSAPVTGQQIVQVGHQLLVGPDVELAEQLDGQVAAHAAVPHAEESIVRAHREDPLPLTLLPAADRHDDPPHPPATVGDVTGTRGGMESAIRLHLDSAPTSAECHRPDGG
jgi:hypothetical protein